MEKWLILVDMSDCTMEEIVVASDRADKMGAWLLPSNIQEHMQEFISTLLVDGTLVMM